jgi:hypothetical protein
LLADIEQHRLKKFNNSIPFVYATKTYLEDKKKLEEDYNTLLKRLGDNIFIEGRRQSRKGGLI